MRTFTAVAIFVSLLVIAAPVADAWRVPTTSVTTKYDVRAARREKRQLAQKKRVEQAQTVTTPALAQAALTWGSSKAPITIVEFVDMECPACVAFHQSFLPSLKDTYVNTGVARYVVRHYPLTSIHKRADEAARSVICARYQGDAKARALFDAIMSRDLGVFSEKGWISSAEQEVDDLDLAALHRCMAGEVAQQAVLDEKAVGDGVNVKGTPTFLIYGPDGKEAFTMTGYAEETFKKGMEKLLQKVNK